MLGNSLADGSIGYIDAVILSQRLENVVFALYHIEVETVVIGLHRDLHIVEEEALFVFAHCLKNVHVLYAAVEHRAAVRCDDCIKEVVASFKSSLKDSSRIFAKEACQIVSAYVNRARTWCTQSG